MLICNKCISCIDIYAIFMYFPFNFSPSFQLQQLAVDCSGSSSSSNLGLCRNSSIPIILLTSISSSTSSTTTTIPIIPGICRQISLTLFLGMAHCQTSMLLWDCRQDTYKQSYTAIKNIFKDQVPTRFLMQEIRL